MHIVKLYIRTVCTYEHDRWPYACHDTRLLEKLEIDQAGHYLQRSFLIADVTLLNVRRESFTYLSDLFHRQRGGGSRNGNRRGTHGVKTLHFLLCLRQIGSSLLVDSK